MLYATCLTLFMFAGSGLESEGPALAELRRAYALEYFRPETHMALAKYHHDRGNRLLAYYLLETARRTVFENNVFDTAFHAAYWDVKPFDNSNEAEEALLAEYQEDPENPHTLFAIADIYISRADWSNAKKYLAELIALEPEVFENYAAMAEIHRRENDHEQADEVVEGFLAMYPESAEAYEAKIGPLMREHPDQAQVVLEQAMKQHPEEATFVFNTAVLLQRAGNLKEAEDMFVRAAALGTDNAYVQGWVGRFFLRVRQDEEKSLHYYLNAYFIDPHFYDTEHAESRIRTLNSSAAAAMVEKAEQEGRPLEGLLQHANPAVVRSALNKIGQSWNAAAREQVVAALEHDDPMIRMQAVHILIENPDDMLNDQIQAFLEGDDARKRGLACHLAVGLWEEKGVERLRPMLQDESQLVRYDAIVALWYGGGEKGRQMVREYGKDEQNEWLARMIQAFERELP